MPVEGFMGGVGAGGHHCQPVADEFVGISSSNGPKLSLLIPVGKDRLAASTVRDWLKSLDKATLSSIEVVIVLDGLVEPSARFLHSIDEAAPNWVVTSLTSAQGPGSARNVGLDLCTGEFVQFVDDDDFPQVRTVLDQLTFVLGSYDLLIGQFVVIEYGDEPPLEALVGVVKPGAGADVMGISSLSESAWIQPAVWRLVFRREFLVKSGVRFQALRYGEDLLFLIELLEARPTCLTTSAKFYAHVAGRPNSLSRRPERQEIQRLLGQLENWIWRGSTPEVRSIASAWAVRVALRSRSISNIVRVVWTFLTASQALPWPLFRIGCMMLQKSLSLVGFQRDTATAGTQRLGPRVQRRSRWWT